MRGAVLALTALAASALAGAAGAAPNLEVKNAAARIVVLPEKRSDIEVTVYHLNPRLPLSIERIGDQVVIDGRLWPPFVSCHGSGAALHAYVFGRGDFAVTAFPQVLVRTPMDVHVSVGGAVQGSIARSQDVDLQQGGCGDWTVADVAGDLRVRLSGIGALRAGASGSADLDLAGAGSVTAGPVAGTLFARISGSGHIRVRSAATADLTISGSGSVTTGAVANGLSAHVSGVGGLKVARLDGPMVVDVSGVGHVEVPSGHVTHMSAHLSGAGAVEFGGVADSLDAGVSGTGSVDVAKVTGPVEQHVSGVGSVRIGGR
ncbi:MAG TPA: DUF2807 domain-containing protein [Caulobacteraceae bacterium]|nr:DUF2807 domain-containing protein [Caulobacteraceae bacterium]